MKMNKIAAVVLATLSLASASAMAATKVVDLSSIASTKTDFSGVLSFSGFDSALGTLTGVTVNLYSDVSGTVRLTNYNTYSVTTTPAVDAALSLSLLNAGSYTSLATGGLYSGNVTLTAAGTSGAKVTTPGSLTLHGTETVTTGLDSFLSSSPLSAYVKVNAVSSVAGAENVLSTFRTSGTAYGTVTYTYTAAPVPEPETYGMLLAGLGLMGVVARRKRASRQA
ncbi:choice-of-anchor E domain-containing protein [Oxalobacteraceae bacterium A2-2]